MTHFTKTLWILLLICIVASPSLKGTNQPPSFPSDFMSLPQQDKALIRDLKLLNYPPKEWKIQDDPSDVQFCYDVVIVGGGMAGLSAGAALFREGIYNIKIFDQNAPGCEGPWTTYARMKTLRSPKDLMGPALEIPHLTFHAWFEAQWGQEAWKQLGKIPNAMWQNYLNWYRQAMQLPVEHCWTLVAIHPMPDDCFHLEFVQPGQRQIVKAQKVVLATGRSGFGGSNIPDFVKELPRNVYAHTCESIDFDALKQQRIGVIGVGASGFDAAAVALETGAQSVDVIMRRARLPSVNKFASLYYKSLGHGFYSLDDRMRWDFMCAAFDPGIPPPIEALQRLKGNSGFRLRPNTTIVKMSFDGSQVQVDTNQGRLAYDFIILGTGFNIDGFQQPELRPLMDHIALWQDRMPPEIVKDHPFLGRFPYLGPIFEFLPKVPGAAPYLKNLYCFNYGSTMSHALLSSDIPAISIGARRLAEGIAADFFIQDSANYLKELKEFNLQDFNQEEFFKAEAKGK